MRLATFVAPGGEEPRAGEVRGDRVVAFEAGTRARPARASATATPADGEAFALADVTLLAPVPRPRAIFGIGLNYAAHARETGNDLPEAPIVFMKLPSSSAPPSGPVRCPAVVRRLDYEVELAVVMGADGEIAGYAVADDVSARDLQKREPQWTRAKGADTFCPWGPWITTADEVPDPEDLRLTTHVNGELRQDAHTSDLIFGPRALVDFIAEAITLEPGDLILTGTPSGVGMAMDPPRFLAVGRRRPLRDRGARRDRAPDRLSGSRDAADDRCVQGDIALSGVIGALSYALDITEGQPAGHAVRSCMIGMRIAEELRLPARVRSDLFYALLLKDAGCSANAERMAALFGADDQSRSAPPSSSTGPARAAFVWSLRTVAPGGRCATASPTCRGSTTRATSRASSWRRAATAAPRSRACSTSPRRRRRRSAASTSTGTAAACRTACAVRRSRCSRASCASPRPPRSSMPPAACRRPARWPSAAAAAGSTRRSSTPSAVCRDRGFWRTLDDPDVSGWEPADLLLRRRRRPPRPDRRGVRPRHRRQVAVHRAPLRARRRDRRRHRRGLGFDAATRRDLRRAGLLHDIGKLAISNLILDKPGKLTDAEFALVKEHPVYSLEILARAPCFAADRRARGQPPRAHRRHRLPARARRRRARHADARARRRRRLRGADRRPAVPRPAAGRGGARHRLLGGPGPAGPRRLLRARAHLGRSHPGAARAGRADDRRAAALSAA